MLLLAARAPLVLRAVPALLALQTDALYCGALQAAPRRGWGGVSGGQPAALRNLQ
jgi:hypothetical protein